MGSSRSQIPTSGRREDREGSSMMDYDFVAIGAGSAAFAAAIRATSLGARVALIEKGTVYVVSGLTLPNGCGNFTNSQHRKTSGLESLKSPC